MVNVIKMELYRLFRTKSLYVTAAVCAGVIILLVMLTSALINIVTDVSASDLTVSMSDSAEGTTVSVSDTASQSGGTNPADFCSGFISGLCGIFVVIFTAIFIHGFYRDGYSKNVIACVKYRWYFQVSKAVCIAVYSAVILAVASVVSLIMSAISLNSFEFEYMGVFFQFLLGEFFLLNAIGLLSAFLTELTYSKVTAIVYILNQKTKIIIALSSGSMVTDAAFLFLQAIRGQRKRLQITSIDLSLSARPGSRTDSCLIGLLQYPMTYGSGWKVQG